MEDRTASASTGLRSSGRRTSQGLAFPVIGGSPSAPGSSEPAAFSLWLDRGGWFSGVLPVFLGGLVIALGYASGRASDGAGAGVGLYWLGQALIWLPAVYRMLSPATDTRTRVSILVAIATVQGLLTWAYSPDQFRFTDELQHVRSLDDVIRTHHLFTPNSFLPVSPAFPGLEILTRALMAFTRLSLFTCGVLVSGLTHVLLPVFVFMGYRELTGSDRTAGIAAFVYSTAPHYSYLEVLFIYSTPALAYYALAFRSAVRVSRHKASLWTVAAPFAPMLLCHHLTAFAGLAVLGALVIVLGIVGPRELAVRLGILLVLLVVAVLAWIGVMSPQTFGYLFAPVISAVQAVTAPAGNAAAAATISPAPSWEPLAAMLGALLLLIGSCVGVALALRSHASRVPAWLTPFALVYPGVLAFRVLAPDGTSTATRMLTYAMLLVAYPVAVALETLWPRTLRSGRRVATAVGVGAVLALAGIVTGLPAAWERIPGRFQVASFEAGIDQRVAGVGRWATNWSRGASVACDFDVCSTIGGYSQATISSLSSTVFYEPTVNRLNSEIANLTLSYMVTDRRWTQQVPPTGEYFFDDTRAGTFTRPLSPALLRRIDGDPLLDRVYDDGVIHAYYSGLVWSP